MTSHETTPEPRLGRAPRQHLADLSRLLHPVFLVALLALLLNDHLWKGAALLPGWLTGKLSDFAGLVVAPVLSASLVSCRWVRLRVLAFMLPVVLFASINIFPRFALSWDAAWSFLLRGMTGMSYRSVSDLTDLLALAILPLAGWLAFAPSHSCGKLRRWRLAAPVRLLERVVASAALLACLATSAPPEPTFAAAYLYNTTQVELRIRVRYFEGAWPCEETVIDSQSLLVDGAFGKPTRVILDPLDSIVLDGVVLRTSPERKPQCGAVLLEIPGLALTLVTWRDLEAIDTAKSTLDSKHSVRIEGLQTARELYGGSPFDIREYAPGAAFASCWLDSGTSTNWSCDGEPKADQLRSIAREEGCSVLHFSNGSPVLRLCVPATLIPFTAGESLVPEVTETGLVIESQETSARWELIAGSLDDLPLTGLSLEPSDCDPQPRACGGFEIPGLLQLGEHTVAPGDGIAWPDSGSTSGTLYLSRASHVLTAPLGCQGPDAAVGDFAEMVLVERGE